MARANASSRTSDRAYASYWQRTHWPLQSLYFLLPLLVAYEVGVVMYAGSYDISARRLLRMLFEWADVTGYYLPGIAVVVMLLCWHMVRKDPWRPEPQLYILMWIESIALALPLFVFMIVLFRQPALPAAAPPDPQSPAAARLMHVADHGPTAQPSHPHAAVSLSQGEQGNLSNVNDWRAGLVFSVGAGIYEELLFRLIAIALLHLLLVDVLGLPDHYGAVGAIGLSAVAFAMYHFSPTNPFDWGKFLFYSAAGIYFAAVYVLRGFGIVAATHALYDILLVAMTQRIFDL